MALTTQLAEVRVRTNWTDDWSDVVDYLWADRTEFVAGPNVASAELAHKYGKIKRQDSGVFTDELSLRIVGQFVWVRQQNGVLFRNWYGFVAREIDKMDGDETQEFSGTGVERFTCLGLGAILDRIFITKSIVLIDDASETVDRAIGFNMGPRGEFQANKSTTNSPEGFPVFASVLTESGAEPWSTVDILLYLFHWFAPTDSSGETAIQFELSGQFAELENVFPVLDPDRRTVKRIIDTLIDRRRMYGYTIEVDGDTNEAFVRVFTYANEDVDLPSGAFIPANSTQGTLLNDLRERETITILELTRSENHQYDRVIARGEPATVTFTLSNSFDYDNLEKDWSTSQESEYRTAASGIGSAYTNADQAVKMALNAAVRKREELVRVWRYFRVPPDWDFIDVNNVAKIFATDDQDRNIWFPGLRFLDRLVLLTDHDYSADPVDGLIPANDNTPTDSQAEPIKPFVAIRRNQSDPFQWEFIDRMAGGYGETANRDEEAETGGIDFSASVRMQDGTLGILINIHGHGTAQHVIGQGDFVPIAGDAADAAGPKALLDWLNMMATVTMELDWPAEAIFPEEAEGFVPLEKTLVIPVRGKRADWLAAETLLDIDTDATQIRSSTTAGYITDDRGDLLDLAQTAHEWYSVTRNSLRWSDHRGDAKRVIGELITSLVDGTNPVDEVNTVVTSITFDLRGGGFTTQTQAADIDFGGL